MERHYSLAQYRNMDLCILGVILAACEYAVTRGASRWFPDQLYTVSVTAAVCAIVLMRWGAWGGLHAALGGLVFSLTSGGSASQLATYAVGNLGCLVLLPLLKGNGKARIRDDKLFTALFALGVAVCMQLGRSIVALLLGAELTACVGFFTTDALTGLFTVVVVSLARKWDGVFEDQKSYLIRCQKQREQEKGGF